MKLSSISESEYAGLEDNDEFEEEESYIYCARCDAEHTITDAPVTPCENCGSIWCYDCLPGGKKWMSNDEKLSLLKMGFQTDPPLDVSEDMDAQDIYEKDWTFDLLLTCPYCPRENGFILATDLTPLGWRHSQLLDPHVDLGNTE